MLFSSKKHQNYLPFAVVTDNNIPMNIIFDASYRAFLRLFTKPFRTMFWRSILVTISLLAVLWIAIRHVFLLYGAPVLESFLPGLPHWLSWLSLVAFFTFGIGLAILLAFLITPITAFIGSFFVDEAIKIIETTEYPHDIPGNAMEFTPALLLSLRFFLVSLLANIFVFLLIFFPPVHMVAFFLVNSYLLGKEYFILNALRFHDKYTAEKIYLLNKKPILAAGFLIALFISIPFLNLLTPLFAAAQMAYLYKNLHKKQKMLPEA